MITSIPVMSFFYSGKAHAVFNTNIYILWNLFSVMQFILLNRISEQTRKKVQKLHAFLPTFKDFYRC